MATFYPASSLLIEVLQIFRSRIGASDAWTVNEISQALIVHHIRNGFGPELEFLYQFSAPYSDTLEQWLTAALSELAELGLVAPAAGSEESSGFPRWRLGESWRPPEPPSDGGNGGGGRIGPAADGDDGDGAGGGLREALGHPVLLALPEDDFDELVDGLFEGVRP